MGNSPGKVSAGRSWKFKTLLIALLSFGPFACTAYLWTYTYDLQREVDKSYLVIDSLTGANKRLEKELIAKEKNLKFYETKFLQLERNVYQLSGK